MSYYGGKTDAVDLCSVSGCKPNYLTYNAFPAPGVAQGTGSNDGNKYVIRIPLAAVGSPTDKSLLEEVMAFVVASPQAGAAPQNNGTDFLDIAPLQIEGTKTFNARFGAPADTGRTTPLAGLAVVGAAVLLRRRRTRGIS
jgi:MYXO-CTERM domain-containing protein